MDVRGKFGRLGRAAGDASGFLLHANLRGVVARAGRWAFEAYLSKMRFVTGQPSNNSH
jgi:hypothetical protein